MRRSSCVVCCEAYSTTLPTSEELNKPQTRKLTTPSTRHSQRQFHVWRLLLQWLAVDAHEFRFAQPRMHRNPVSVVLVIVASQLPGAGETGASCSHCGHCGNEVTVGYNYMESGGCFPGRIASVRVSSGAPALPRLRFVRDKKPW